MTRRKKREARERKDREAAQKAEQSTQPSAEPIASPSAKPVSAPPPVSEPSQAHAPAKRKEQRGPAQSSGGRGSTIPAAFQLLVEPTHEYVGNG